MWIRDGLLYLLTVKLDVVLMVGMGMSFVVPRSCLTCQSIENSMETHGYQSEAADGGRPESAARPVGGLHARGLQRHWQLH